MSKARSGTHAVLVNGNDERDVRRQQGGQDANRAGESEDRRRELHVDQVEVQLAHDPSCRSDTADVPPARDADGTLSRRTRQLVRRHDHRFDPGWAQVDGEPAGVVGHPIPRRVQVAADQPDSRTAHARRGQDSGGVPTTRLASAFVARRTANASMIIMKPVMST